MKIRNKLVLLIILLTSSLLFAQDIESQLNLQYNSKIDYKRQVYNRIQQMIRDNPNADELDKLYFNLAELSCEIDRNNPLKIASYYRQILLYNRDFNFKDIVLYNIGYYSYQGAILANGQARQMLSQNYQVVPDSLLYSETLFYDALYYYKRLIEEHPTSSYYSETAWRLAEIYYSIGEENSSRVAYLRALDYYAMALSKKNSDFYLLALSGKAWTLFALQETDSAMKVEFSLLNQLDSIPNLKNDEILAQDAVNNIAWTFSRDENLDFENSSATTARMELRLADLISEDRKKQIILAVADQLLEADKPQAAIGLYETFQELFPLSADAPLIADAKIDIYRKYPDISGGLENATQAINAVRDEMLTKFNPLSNWYAANKNKDILTAVEIIRNNIEFNEPSTYNDFISSPDKNNYLRYRVLVNDFGGYEKFESPLSLQKQKQYRKNLVYMSQKLAQTTNSPDDYLYALRDLKEYNEYYPLHEEQIDFEKNIFFCYEKLYNLTQTDSLILARSDLRNVDSLYIVASRRYEEILRNDIEWEIHQNELARVIFKRAEFLTNRASYQEAISDYLTVTALKAENEIISDAFRRAAEIALLEKDYPTAEGYLRQAMNFTMGYAQSDVYKNIIEVVRQNAENLLAQKKYNLAADEFLRLSLELEAIYPEKSLDFLTCAIDVYEDLGDDLKVNELLNIIAVRQNLTQTISVYRNTWQEADKLEDFPRALALREDFISRYPGSNEAFRAKLQIIDIYENKLNEKNQAAELYLQLFNDHLKYDLGRERPESIYLNALRVYQDIDDQEKCAQLTADFIKKYPDYSLVDLNLIYSDTDNFRTSIRKLKKLKESINSLFREKEYGALRQDISEFLQIANALNVDTLKIDFSEDNLLFEKYLSYADYFKNLKLEVSLIENNFLLQKPQELIPVSAETRWQENMVAGEDLIGQTLQKCDDFRNNIMTILQDGSKYQLKTADYTHAVWAVAAAYDHGYEVVDQQIKNFVVKSNQLNRPELEDNNYLQSELKRSVIAEGREYSFDFQLAAARFYQNLLFQFYDNSSYNDLWTRKSLTRLNEWGIRDAGGAIVMLDEKLMIAEESYANEEIEIEFNKIFAEYQNRDYNSAQIKFMNFISSYPGHKLTYNALYFAGECYYNMGQFSKAMEIFEKVIDFELEKTPDALLRLGHCFNASGDKKKAYAYWNRLIEEYPDHYLTEVIKLTFDQLREQEELLASSKSSSKERKITMKYRSYIQNYKQGKYKTARKGFASISRKYPEHPLAYSSLFMEAETRFQEEDYSEAADLYLDVVSSDGNKTVNSLYRLGQCAQKNGNTDLRDRYWQQIVNDYPGHYLADLVAGGDIALKAQRIIKMPAAAERKTVPKIYTTSNTVQFQYKKALMSFRYNNFQEAATAFEVFLKDNPDNRLAFNARFLMAESYQNISEFQKALDIYNDLLPQSGAKRPQTLLHIAEIYLAMNNIPAAQTTLQEIKVNYAGTFDAAQANKMLMQIPGVNENEE